MGYGTWNGNAGRISEWYHPYRNLGSLIKVSVYETQSKSR
jgi:hypothetical protein